MSDGFLLVDRESVEDLGRYAARARSLDSEGAMRLQSVGSVLAAWVCALPGSGLMGDGTVLGLRTFALAEPIDADLTVPLGAVTDRTARTDLDTRFPWPPTREFPQWGALSAPRSGWEHVGQVPVQALVDAATAGITEIGEGAGPGAGALAVAELRRRVWGRLVHPAEEETETGEDLAASAVGDAGPDGSGVVAPAERPTAAAALVVTAGAGFAAYALGFLAPESNVPVHAHGPWRRLTCPGGYVLTR